MSGKTRLRTPGPPTQSSPPLSCLSSFRSSWWKTPSTCVFLICPLVVRVCAVKSLGRLIFLLVHLPLPWHQAVHSLSIHNDVCIASALSWDFCSFSRLPGASAGPPTWCHHPQPQGRGWSWFLAQTLPWPFPLSPSGSASDPHTLLFCHLQLPNAGGPSWRSNWWGGPSKMKIDPHARLYSNVAMKTCSSQGLLFTLFFFFFLQKWYSFTWKNKKV